LLVRSGHPPEGARDPPTSFAGMAILNTLSAAISTVCIDPKKMLHDNQTLDHKPIDIKEG